MFLVLLLQSAEGNSLAWDEKLNCFSRQHCKLVHVLPAAEFSPLYDPRDNGNTYIGVLQNVLPTQAWFSLSCHARNPHVVHDDLNALQHSLEVERTHILYKEG